MTPLVLWIDDRPYGTPSLVTFLPAFWLLVPGAIGLIGVTEIVGADQSVGGEDLGHRAHVDREHRPRRADRIGLVSHGHRRRAASGRHPSSTTRAPRPQAIPPPPLTDLTNPGSSDLTNLGANLLASRKFRTPVRPTSPTWVRTSRADCVTPRWRVR